MGRKPKETMIVNAESITDVLNHVKARVDEEKKKRPYTIMSASIEDDFCSYSFEITEGIGLGDTHAVKGKGIVKDSMKDALAKFNVHMAFIDDVFKHSEIEVEDIDSLHGHDLTFLYVVTGFKIRGTADSEQIILIGTKHIAAGGRIKLETPKISMDQFSSYKWYNELKAAADQAREEVALYKEGNYTQVEEVDEKELRKQTKLQFVQPAEEGEEDGEAVVDNDEIDPDFEKAVV